MSEKNVSELMHIQNELLGDLKNVETKLSDRIKIINQSLEEHKDLSEKRIKNVEKNLSILLEKFEALPKIDNSNNKNNDDKFFLINKKIEETESKLESKIKNISENLKESVYKYDRVILDNFTIPGLIGPKAPFKSMRSLLENIYKKTLDNSKSKEKHDLDLKFYKEKLENIINSNKKELEMLEIKIRSNYNSKISDLEKMYQDRFDGVEERLNTMRIDNGKYRYDLIEKYKEVSDVCDKMNESLKKAFDEYNGDFTKHKKVINELNIKIKKFEEISTKFEVDYDKFTENYIKFEDNFIKFEEGMIKINENKVNYSILEGKIKELEKSILIWKKKSAIDIFEKNDTADLSKSNFLAGLIEEDEKNSFLIKKKLDIARFKIAQNFLKKNEYQISEENDENKKVNKILYDSDFFRDININNINNINNFSYDSSGIKKAKMPIYRVRSGKIFNQYPFISHDSINDYTTYNKKSGRDTDVIDNLKMGKNCLKKNHIQKEIDFPYHNHKYRYLDKKIDILGKTLVDNINKIIAQINLIKKYKCNKCNTIKNEESNEIINKEKDETEENNTIIHSIQNKKFFKDPSVEKNNDISNLKTGSLSFKYRKINSKFSQKPKPQKKNLEQEKLIKK